MRAFYERGPIDPKTAETIRAIEHGHKGYCGWAELPIAETGYLLRRAEPPIAETPDTELQMLLDLRSKWVEKGDDEH